MLSLPVRVRSHFNFFAEADVLFLIIGNALYIAVLIAELIAVLIAVFVALALLSEILDEKMRVVVCEIMKNHWSELWLPEL